MVVGLKGQGYLHNKSPILILVNIMKHRSEVRRDQHCIRTQCTEWILNEIAKATNETFTGLKCMFQGLKIYFV